MVLQHNKHDATQRHSHARTRTHNTHTQMLWCGFVSPSDFRLFLLRKAWIPSWKILLHFYPLHHSFSSASDNDLSPTSVHWLVRWTCQVSGGQVSGKEKFPEIFCFSTIVTLRFSSSKAFEIAQWFLAQLWVFFFCFSRRYPIYSFFLRNPSKLLSPSFFFGTNLFSSGDFDLPLPQSSPAWDLYLADISHLYFCLYLNVTTASIKRQKMTPKRGIKSSKYLKCGKFHQNTSESGEEWDQVGGFKSFYQRFVTKRANSWILLYKFLLFHSHFPLLNHFL